jgi:uncharacterized protein
VKTSVSHLPKNKIKELNRIIEIITDNATTAKIILFGSHARGDWVADKYKEGHITYEYQSDYDILIVVTSEKLHNDVVLWDNIKQKILRDPEVYTTVNMIVDTIHFVNQKLTEGNYFYVDIINEGILLNDQGNIQLLSPQEYKSLERKDIIQKDYEFWMSKVRAFIKDYLHNMEDGELKNAAFHLSQAVESLYFAVLLVFTGYKPKSHNLEKIEDLVAELLPQGKSIFPKITEEQKALYNILVRAYIDARYSQDFEIEADQLNYLYENTLRLERIVKIECEKKIAKLA